MSEIKGIDLNDSVIEHYIKRYYSTSRRLRSYDFTIILLQRYGDKAIFKALKNRHYNTVRYLIEDNIDINVRDKNNATVLMVACYDEHPVNIIQYLLDHGANPNDTDKNGNTALLVAVASQKLASFDVIQCLVEYKNSNGIVADVNAVNDHGYSAIFYVTVDVNIVKYLIKHGANINLRSDCNMSLLMDACSDHCIDTIQYLLNVGANVYDKDDDYNTVLMYVLNKSDQKTFDILVMIIEHVVKRDGIQAAKDLINSKNRKGESIMMKLCNYFNDCIDMVKYLVEGYGASIDKTDYVRDDAVKRYLMHKIDQ